MKPDFTFNEIDSADRIYATSVLLTIADMAYGSQSDEEHAELAKAILHELLVITPYIHADIAETIFSSGPSDKAIETADEVAAFLTPIAIRARVRGCVVLARWPVDALNLTLSSSPFLSII